MAEEEVFYKKNVPYRVGVRFNLRDTEGAVLTTEDPYIAIPKKELRDFIQANRYGLQNGLIVEVPEPPMEIITPNSITDEQAEVIVKNYFDLKKRLPEITSESTLIKLLDTAKNLGRSQKTIQLILDRYEEISPNAMQGVERA